MKISLAVFLVYLNFVLGRKGFGPTDQEWGYVEVRQGAKMFWWLHHTTATTKYTDKPLIIWLQGGPGASSTMFGNFKELGPLDENLMPRNTSWVHHANVMFVDNPVGTGFSHVKSNGLLVTNNTQIASDFVHLLKGFYKEFPQYEVVPLYIFCESYGGKMTAEIALHLHQAIKAKTIKSNFKGVGLGDSWISPITSCLTWAPYLYNLGTIDTNQFNKLTKQALELKDLVDRGMWYEATAGWIELEHRISDYTNFVDFYNVIKEISDASFLKQGQQIYKPDGNRAVGGSDENLMMKVKDALKLETTWEDNDEVFNSLGYDFMQPVTHIVERLLNDTDLTVAVYNGQLDLIVDTPGTVQWVDKMNYKGSNKWDTAEKTAFAVNGIREGYQKKAGNLVFYWVNRAGHMVPSDNPNAMLHILKEVTHNFKV